MNNDNGGFAFPTDRALQAKGMTLRDYFAAKAPITFENAISVLKSQGVIQPTGGEILEMLAALCGGHADEMLKERAK